MPDYTTDEDLHLMTRGYEDRDKKGQIADLMAFGMTYENAVKKIESGGNLSPDDKAKYDRYLENRDTWDSHERKLFEKKLEYLGVYIPPDVLITMDSARRVDEPAPKPKTGGKRPKKSKDELMAESVSIKEENKGEKIAPAPLPPFPEPTATKSGIGDTLAKVAKGALFVGAGWFILQAFSRKRR